MSIFKDKNPERTTILEILVYIFSLLPETLEELFKKINEFKNLKNQTFDVKKTALQQKAILSIK